MMRMIPESFEKRVAILTLCISLCQLVATIMIPIAAYYLFDQFTQEYNLKQNPIVTRTISGTSKGSYFFEILNPGKLPLKEPSYSANKRE